MNATEKPKTPEAVRTVQQIDESYSRLLAGGLPLLPEVYERVPVSPDRIGSSIATNSHTRSQRGSRGISSRQRDLLCWAANSLEKVYTQKNMSFLTYTLPDLSDQDLEAVQNNWSDIVNTVVTYIQRDLKNVNLRTAIVGCSELQLERYKSSGRSYPHLHLIFRGRFHSRANWAIKPRRFRDIWRRSCGRFLDASHYCWDSSENVEQIRKSSGGYLAKYVSKCGSKGGMGGATQWHPSDWIVCSRRLRSLYEKSTRSGCDVGNTLLGIVANWRHGMGFKQPIVISTPACGDRTIGQWGWLRGEEIFPTYAQVHAA
jgi:hypothetical protein